MTVRSAHALLGLLLAGALPGAPAAGQLIFADGFESGDASAWSATVGLVGAGCAAGSGPVGTLGGDLGAAPDGAFTHLACLEVSNDLAFERREVAWSGIPLPATAGLLDPGDLVLIGPGGRRVASQFRVLSRWGGPLVDGTRPIRWLAVSTPARVSAASTTAASTTAASTTAASTTVYELRRYPSLPAPADPFAASIVADGADFVVDTGLASFRLDPENPALFESIAVDLDDDGAGLAAVYAHAPGAGPRLVFPGAGGDVELSTAGAGEVEVDAGGFEIVENGPVQVVVALRGHFVDPGGESLCDAVMPAYERFGFTLVATFFRASRDASLELHFRNECADGVTSGDGFGLTDDAVDVSLVAFELPFPLGTPTSFLAATGAVSSSAAGFAGTTLVEQAKGGTVDTWTTRVARGRRGATVVQSGQTLAEPLVGVADGTLLVAATMPWMRYREPQSIAVVDRTVSLRLVGERLTIGEGKGLWSLARLHLAPVALAGPPAAYLAAIRDDLAAGLERRLLLRASLADINGARLFPSLGTTAVSSFESDYLTTIEALHEQTVEPGGQWDRAKTYGSQLWPDIQFDEFAIDYPNPFVNSPVMNYWNALGSEAIEFLRSGDPRWAWDFTLPQLWLQLFTAYLDVGDRTHSNRNGVAVNSGGSGVEPLSDPPTGEGHWHRSNFGSDDYTYDVGMHVGYALHPSPAVRDRFAAAGRALTDRYSTPEGFRTEFVDERDVVRGAIQHFEMLANCAEFVPGQLGQDCHDRLLDILGEMVGDNLGAALMCTGDDPPGLECRTPSQFMINALMYLFFHRAYLNYGDLGGDLRRALTEGPRRYYQFGMEKLGDGVSIDVNDVFPVSLDCDLTANRRDVVSCVRLGDGDGPGVLQPIYPNTVATLLMAHDLDPAIGLCQIAKNALDAMDPPTRWAGFQNAGAGWWKGAAQMMNGIAFAVGVYETCVP